MELTKEQAISEHRKMWTWLAEHPGKSKEDYFDEHGYEIHIRNNCFCCVYVLQNRPGCRNCGYCPIEWPNGQCINYAGGCGLYTNWRRTFNDGDYYKASFFASQIANLPERGKK